MDDIIIDNEKFYIKGCLDYYGDYLYIDLFEIKPKYRGKKLSYIIWKEIQNTYKVDIRLCAFFTLIPYYKKLGFKDLGKIYEEDYHELILEY